MKLHIYEALEDKFTKSKVIPFQYCHHIKPYIAPIFLEFPDVSILLQDKFYNGCTLRRMVIFSTQKRTLLMAESQPKLVIQTSTNRLLYTRFAEQGKLLLQSDEYGVIHGSTEYSCIVLTPGMQEVIRLEFTSDALTQGRLLDATQHWLTNFVQEKSWFYGSGKISDILQQQLNDIINTPANTPEEEAVFGARCQDILLHIAADQAKQITA
ncbi:hypothetical protein [Chitinophaga sp. HK235]|uniref:hypothetical protein n=1 Tax=Chitinophaga sp. HK235 TaxID=2952571 RepID=UPI001BA82824|nr:hypothetical protein [Chitinophaga sp. HK235]